ncbi:carbohydrate ABC transporter permease, partial [Actinomadura adrarensis]
GPSAYAVLVGLTAVALIMLIPFAVVLLNAVKAPEEYSANGPWAMPEGVNLDSVTAFWERVGFGQVLLNSVFISGSVALLAVLLSVLNAYALGIGRIKGRMWVLAVLLLANTLPQEALVYPLYYLSKEVGLYDTRLSMIIVFTVIQSAFGTYLLSSVLAAFPRPLLEAARIDGAGRWQVLW